MVVISLRFSFLLIDPRHRVEETDNPEMSTGIDNKSSDKHYSLAI